MTWTSVMVSLLRWRRLDRLIDYRRFAVLNRLPRRSWISICEGAGSRASLRRDRQLRLHVGMEAAVIFGRARFLQNRRDGLLRRHVDIEVAVARRGGMDEDVLVD